MSGPVDPTDLFGVARALDADEAAEIRRALTEAWTAQHGRPPSDLDDDLSALAALAPGRDAAGVRGLAIGARRLNGDRRPLPERLLIPVGATRALVTAEGRIMLAVLEMMAEQQTEAISRSLLLFAYERAAAFYAEPQLRWITKHARGDDPRPTTIAFALLLLVNGSVGDERALRIPTEPDDERDLAQALAPVVDAFAVGIGSDGLNEKEVARGLRSLWPLTQTPTQFVGQVLRREKPTAFWIDPPEEDALVDRLGALLARRMRPALNRTQVDDALEALLGAYAVARPALVARRLAFDRRDRSRRLADRFGAAFDRARVR